MKVNGAYKKQFIKRKVVIRWLRYVGVHCKSMTRHNPEPMSIHTTYFPNINLIIMFPSTPKLPFYNRFLHEDSVNFCYHHLNYLSNQLDFNTLTVIWDAMTNLLTHLRNLRKQSNIAPSCQNKSANRIQTTTSREWAKPWRRIN